MAINQSLTHLTQGNQPLIPGPHALLFRLRGGDIDLGKVPVHSQPGRATGKAGLRPVGPLHRGAGIVASHTMNRRQELRRIPALGELLSIPVNTFQVAIGLDWILHIGHTDFFAHIDIGRARQSQGNGRQSLGRLDTKALVVAEATHGSGLVVVHPELTVPTNAV